MARATTSLPVPLSPVIRTLTLALAMRFAMAISLAHVTDGHGAVLAGRELIDRPECRALFALGARPIEILERCQQQLDGVDRGDGLEIRFWGDEDLDVPLARRPDEQALGVRRPVFLGVPGLGKGFDYTVCGTSDHHRKIPALGNIQDVHDFTSHQFRSSYMVQQ